MVKIDLFKAIEALRQGGLVVYPTDTLYALGADIFNEDAVKKVFRVKKRPFDVPLPVAVSTVVDMEKIAFVDKRVRLLAEHFLPGQLTLVLNKKDVVPDVVTGGVDKIAVRLPDNRFALELLSVFGPLTVTSANIHGMETPNNIRDIQAQLKGVDVYLDHGVLEGLPSTIVDMTSVEPKFLREGKITKKEIYDVVRHG
ncbi:MAG: L-threonylcarbamoyladenylate synthase [Candidatus Thermoplasmatota archaeon]|jgi:L-threonylcarbamoyladenylate synthase|nr:L-threonylcarbamoyladenylate synthase [Candidatus Thermoplasmatota archaeon]